MSTKKLDGFRTILVAAQGDEVRVTLNRPEQRNGLTTEMQRELGEALTAIAASHTARVVTLMGAGEWFCPGADFGAVMGAEPQPAPNWDASLDPLTRVPRLLHEMEAITVAAIRGGCAGAGLGLALACDLRIASSTARFNTAFLDVGVAGDMGTLWSLSRAVGWSRARSLYLLPRKVPAEQAQEIGLVDRVADDDEFPSAVDEIVTRLLRSAPSALRTIKRNFAAAEALGFTDYLAVEAERHLPLFASEDSTEAFRARKEHREPRFTGR